jgi:hypothetical protein
MRQVIRKLTQDAKRRVILWLDDLLEEVLKYE